jgi:hypothetical protein
MTLLSVAVAVAYSIPLAVVIWLALAITSVALRRLGVRAPIPRLRVFLVAWAVLALIVLFAGEAAVAPIGTVAVGILMLGILLWLAALLLNLFGIGRRAHTPAARDPDTGSEGTPSADARRC